MYRCGVASLILFAIGWTSAGCGSLDCGPGTRQVGDECVSLNPQKVTCAEGTKLDGDQCVPDEMSRVRCAQGTKQDGNQCIPDVEVVRCGDYTMLTDGVCVGRKPCAEGDPVCGQTVEQVCGQGRVVQNGECVAPEAQILKLPFVAGRNVQISQGYHGNFSHFDLGRYALDFPVPEGTPITAARGGTVVATRSDSDMGCGELRCADQANYIVIDHGDGTYGRYYHLQRNGVAVDVGDVVCAGETIGQSGNTGFSSGPHLHFDVIDSFSQSLPIYFEELMDISDGVPFIDQELTSSNMSDGQCEQRGISQCWGDAFLHRGILLESSLPCGAIRKDISYKVTGRSFSYKNAVLLGVYSQKTQQWYNQCVRVDAQGSFEADVIWQTADHTNDSFMIITPAVENNGQCQDYPGWKVSMKIFLRSM